MSEAPPSNRFDKSFLTLLSQAGTRANGTAPSGQYETTLAELVKAHGTDEMLAAAEWLRLDMMLPAERDGDTTATAANAARRIMDANFNACDAYVELPDGSFLIHLPHCDAPTRGVIATAVGKTIQQRVLKCREDRRRQRPQAHARRSAGSRAAAGGSAAAAPTASAATSAAGAEGRRKAPATNPLVTTVIRFLEQRGDFQFADVPKTLPPNVQTVYRPVWHVRRQLLTSYSCLPAVRHPTLPMVVGDALLPESARPEATSALDLPLLRRAVGDLTGALKQRRRMIVMPPLHAQTLFRPRFRDEFMAVCRNCPALTRRHLVFELVVPPEEMPGFQATDVVAQLRHWCRAVIVRLPLETDTLYIWKELGVHAVGIDLTDRAGDERQVLKALDRFAALAENTGLQSYVQGLPSFSTTTAAVCAGFSYIAGQTLPAEADTLSGIEPFTPKMMFESLFSDGGGPVRKSA